MGAIGLLEKPVFKPHPRLMGWDVSCEPKVSISPLDSFHPICFCYYNWGCTCLYISACGALQGHTLQLWCLCLCSLPLPQCSCTFCKKHSHTYLSVASHVSCLHTYDCGSLEHVLWVVDSRALVCKQHQGEHLWTHTCKAGVLRHWASSCTFWSDFSGDLWVLRVTTALASLTVSLGRCEGSRHGLQTSVTCTPWCQTDKVF